MKSEMIAIASGWLSLTPRSSRAAPPWPPSRSAACPFRGRQVHASTLMMLTDLVDHSRGSAEPLAQPSTAIMSARSRAASWAQKRAIAKPVPGGQGRPRRRTIRQAPDPFDHAASPGTIKAVAMAVAPFATAARASFPPNIAVKPPTSPRTPACRRAATASGRRIRPATCARPSPCARTPRFRRAAAKRSPQDRCRWRGAPGRRSNRMVSCAASRGAHAPRPQRDIELRGRSVGPV